MAEHLVTSETPEEIGDLVASEFANGESYVHLTGLTFSKSAPFVRSRQIVAVCERVGALAQMNFDPTTAIERLDENSEGVRPKNHFHTSGAALIHPEKVVSYWNGQPIATGDAIDILPIDRIVEHMKEQSAKDTHMQTMLERIQEKCEIGINEPIYNPSTGMVRFDKDILDIRDINRVDLFFRLINEEQRKIDARDEQQELAESVELGGGDALFFRNDEVLHRRRLSRVKDRLTFRVLLDTFVNPLHPEIEDIVPVGGYL